MLNLPPALFSSDFHIFWVITVPHCHTYMSLENANSAPVPTFIQFINRREMGTIIKFQGVEWVAKLVVHVLDRINAVGINKDKWLHRVKEVSGFNGGGGG